VAEANGWNVRNVYLYLVCFTTLVMVIAGSVRVVMTVVDMAYPQIYYGPTAITPPPDRSTGRTATADSESQQELARQRFEAQTRRSNVVGLLDGLALIGVALPVYLYHWRKIQRAPSA